MRSYLQVTGKVLVGVPSGPRGYQVLAASARGEAGSQLALAQQLGVDRTVMTYLLDDLERSGLLERKPDPADRRVRRIVLTDEGIARMCDLERQLRAAEEELLEPLESTEREMLRHLLHRLATRSGGHDGRRFEESPRACEMAAAVVVGSPGRPAAG
jgi:DNA-binding MarR family transcriptional regulator